MSELVPATHAKSSTHASLGWHGQPAGQAATYLMDVGLVHGTGPRRAGGSGPRGQQPTQVQSPPVLATAHLHPRCSCLRACNARPPAKLQQRERFPISGKASEHAASRCAPAVVSHCAYSAYHTSLESTACNASMAALARGPVGTNGSDTRMLSPPSRSRVTRFPTALCSQEPCR